MSEEEAFLKETEALHRLRALEEIERNPKISQRELAGRLGVALGITNALLKSLVRRGLIKIRGENNRSLTYHLTHAGVLQKSKLAMEWTFSTVSFYRQAGKTIAGKLRDMVAGGVKAVVLYGNNDITEITILVSAEAGVTIQGIVDGEAAAGRYILGLPVFDLDELAKAGVDAIITSTKEDNDQLLAELNGTAGADIKIIGLFD